MALIECRECTAEVSSRAKACPNCGISNPGASKGGKLLGLAAFFGAMVAVAAFLLPVVQSQGQRGAPDLPAHTESISGARNSEPVIFNHATEADKNLMKTWEKQNDQCEGSSGSPAVAAICPQRDATTATLKEHGWCWAAPERSGSENQWHRCAIDQTGVDQNPVAELEAFETGVTAGGSQQDQQAIETFQLHASPALKHFETLIASRNTDLGTAEAVEDCGFRSHAWYSEIRNRLAASFATDRSEQAEKASLTDDERVVAKAYAGQVVTSHVAFLIGKDKSSDCQSMKDDPFLSGFDRYAAGQADTLPDGAGRIVHAAGITTGSGSAAVGHSAVTSLGDLPSGMTFGPITGAPLTPTDQAPAPQASAWFPILSVSLHGEPKHAPKAGYVPKYAYHSRGTCMAETRQNVQSMARAGIRGKFLCMYHDQPNSELAAAPIGNF